MKITKARLKEIIKEELQVTLTNEEAGEMFGDEVQEELEQQDEQLDESLDMDKLETLEVAIAEAYNQMTTPTDVDQVYAGSGEPVSKDPRDMHDKAVEFLKGVVEDVASGEMTSSPRTINEDGHTDVPSAARKMKLAIEDAGQILQGLQAVDGELPAWWMSKITIASEYLNKARDYLLTPSQEMQEKLKPSMGAGAYVRDFRNSNAEQFKGKSDKKIQKMAIAAYLDDKERNEEKEVKITKQRLEEIIQEELQAYMLEEGFMDDLRRGGNKVRTALAGAALAGTLAGAAPDASADTINPDQFKQAAAAQADAMDYFVQAKKEFNEKLGVTGKKDYIDKTGAKDFKERKKFGNLYDEAVRFYKSTKKASEGGDDRFPDGGVVLNILDKEKLETQKERAFSNLKIFFGSEIKPETETKQ